MGDAVVKGGGGSASADHAPNGRIGWQVSPKKVMAPEQF